jgi:hypothetical protein
LFSPNKKSDYLDLDLVELCLNSFVTSHHTVHRGLFNDPINSKAPRTRAAMHLSNWEDKGKAREGEKQGLRKENMLAVN